VTELLTRHARKYGATVAVLRALEQDGGYLVEAEVQPVGSPTAGPLRPGPYAFGSRDDATGFVAAVVEALTYLGCDVQPR
jgi:hypothetical protein